MADIKSLGLHQPTALPYLYDEDLLLNHTTESLYTWQVDPIYGENGEVVEDEILQMKDYVVWARGGVVKRAFNLDVEDEEIQQSFVTSFPAWKGSNNHREVTASLNAACQEHSILAIERSLTPSPSKGQDAIEALVVILQTKAHVYFLRGDSHVVSLPFEVERAFPTPQGCLLQRKSSTPTISPASISAPQNSVVSSQLTSSLTKSQHITLKNASECRPSMTLSTVAPNFVVPASSRNAHTPSVFSLLIPRQI